MAMDVVKLFRTAGHDRDDETVTHLEHALQCAALARRDRADDEVVVAALLHDLGHLAPAGADASAHHHGHRGAELLRPFVPARVAWLVEHHVVAKRYLCTVDPRYASRLSPASARSLARQGAALGTEERLALETHPWFADAVRIRRWDDAAKVRNAVRRWTATGRCSNAGSVHSPGSWPVPSDMSADERIGSESRARIAADLAVLGGRLALERFHVAQASARGESGAVSDADLAIHDTLGREIARLFPGDGLVGDEPAFAAPARSQVRYEWVLGPLDDTANFARGMPGFTVSVGVLRGRMPFAGAVYDPVARWLFTGCAGRGAWLNDRPLRARGDAPAATALFAAPTPWATGVPEYVEGWMRRYGARRFGSTALHLCYVALGGLDFVHDDRALLRDVAGAAPVLLEAGGLLTDDAGAPLFPLAPSQAGPTPIALLAGHPRAHADALRDLRAARAAALATGVS